MASIRAQARFAAGRTQVKCLIKHPMETGARHDEKGALIPAHYIQAVRCEYQGRVVMSADWGTGVAQNPYWLFSFKGGAVGEFITLMWWDNLGGTDRVEVQIVA